MSQKQKIIDEDLNVPLNHIMKNSKHASLEVAGVLQSPNGILL